MPSPYLQIQAVTKKFDRTTALEGITLDVQEGEFIFLLGPSGCGKTTLLRIIAGLEETTAGRIIQAGQDVTTLPVAKRNFGIVFQSYALFPNLNVYQNIAYGLENMRQPKEAIQTRVGELLELVGLDDLGSRYPAQLSGGQQQRVALARALAISPDLLLLDEPLSALDARVRANLRIEIKRLQQRLGVTTVMVSHDQEEALTMADRVVVMERGRVVQVGAPEEIYHHPISPFVADFVGLMNFLPAVVADGRRRQVQIGAGRLLVGQEIDQADGEAVMLAIRPEEVRVAPQTGETNLVSARIRGVEFIGAFFRLHLSLAGETYMIAYLSNDQVFTGSLREGVEVLIQLPPDDLRVFRVANPG